MAKRNRGSLAPDRRLIWAQIIQYLRSFHARRYHSCRRALYCDWVHRYEWENDGFVLLYKRMEVKGRFRWPRSSQEVRQLTWQQFDWLMSGLEIEQPKAFKTP